MHKAKNIIFLRIKKKKKREMAQGKRSPKAGYLPLLLYHFFLYGKRLLSREFIFVMTRCTRAVEF